MPKKREPFPMSAKRRKLAVDVLAKILETGSIPEQLKAVEMFLEMERQNQADACPKNWLGSPSSN